MYRIGLLCLFLVATSAQALPPLGLTQVALSADPNSKLAVIDGVAYVSHHTGVSLVDTTGVAERVVPKSSIFQSPYRPTRAVPGENGGVYVGMNFSAGGDVGSGGASLYALSNPTQAVATWDNRFAVGFSSQLWGIGMAFGQPYSDVRLLQDGSGDISPNIGSLPSNWVATADVLPGGLVIGNAVIPNTIGSAGAILDRNNNLLFIDGAGGVTSARERVDGQGLNIGYDLGNGNIVTYGNRDALFIDGQSPPYGSVIVSETEFAVINRFIGSDRVFFPGVNPAGDDLSVPLLDYFPELTTVDFERVIDIASAAGQVHLLLSGNDGLWLYSAIDPTWVPEPTSALLMACALAPLVYRRP